MKILTLLIALSISLTACSPTDQPATESGTFAANSNLADTILYIRACRNPSVMNVVENRKTVTAILGCGVVAIYHSTVAIELAPDLSGLQIHSSGQLE